MHTSIVSPIIVRTAILIGLSLVDNLGSTSHGAHPVKRGVVLNKEETRRAVECRLTRGMHRTVKWLS